MCKALYKKKKKEEEKKYKYIYIYIYKNGNRTHFASFPVLVTVTAAA